MKGAETEGKPQTDAGRDRRRQEQAQGTIAADSEREFGLTTWWTATAVPSDTTTPQHKLTAARCIAHVNCYSVTTQSTRHQ